MVLFEEGLELELQSSEFPLAPCTGAYGFVVALSPTTSGQVCGSHRNARSIALQDEMASVYALSFM